MLKFKDIPLFIKLLTPLAFLFLLIGGILFLGKLNNDRLIAAQSKIQHDGIARITQINALLEKFQTIDGLFYRYLINQSTGNLENGEDKMAELKKQAIQLDADFKILLDTFSGERAANLETLRTEFKKNVIGLQDDGVYDVAIQMMGIDVGFVLKGIGGYSKVYNEFIATLKNVESDIQKDVNQLIITNEKEIESFQTLSMIGTIIASALILLASVGIIIVTVRSIKDISETTGQLAEGNIEIDLESMERKDELGTIIVSLKKFKENQLEVKNLTARQEKLKVEQEEKRQQDMLDLAADFDSQIGGFLESLTSASGKMQSAAETMCGIADETSKSSEIVSVSSGESSANVNAVSAAMEEMSASSNQIASQITSARNKSNDTASNAQKANQTVSNLNNLVDNIDEVVTAIRDIAEQTNLLALNATIEAARAGEAGKGFAVVADEVKKLASETGKKTEEISERISEIQQATRNSVDAMGRIIDNISDIDQSVTGVSAAVEEQNATNKEIVRSVSEASQGVGKVSEIIEEVKKGAQETGTSATSVLNAAKEVTDLSSNLKMSVEQFLNQIRAGSNEVKT